MSIKSVDFGTKLVDFGIWKDDISTKSMNESQGINIDGKFMVANLKKHCLSAHWALRRVMQAIEGKGGYSDSCLQ